MRNELADYGVDVVTDQSGAGNRYRFQRPDGDRTGRLVRPSHRFAGRPGRGPESPAGSGSQSASSTPADVVQRYVELVEADETELVNLVPPDLMERLARR